MTSYREDKENQIRKVWSKGNLEGIYCIIFNYFLLGTSVEILQCILNCLFRVALLGQNKRHLTQCVLAATSDSEC